MDDEVLEVIPNQVARKKTGKQQQQPEDTPHPTPHRTPVPIAAPSEELMEAQAIAEDATVSGCAVLARGSGKGMWCAEVIEPVRKAHAETQAKKAATRQTRDAAFDGVTGAARELLNDCISVECLSNKELATLMRLVYTALGETGYSKITGVRDAMLATLDAFKMGELYELLDKPPKYADDPRLRRAAATPRCRRRRRRRAPRAASRRSERKSYASSFGDVDWVLPKDFDGYEPVGAPPWLSRALIFGASDAQLLKGNAFAYRCAPARPPARPPRRARPPAPRDRRPLPCGALQV